jgi:hypothetical protein
MAVSGDHILLCAELVQLLSFEAIAGPADPPIVEQLVTPNALRQRRFRDRQKALRDASQALHNAPSASRDSAVSGSETAVQTDLEEPIAAAPGVGCRRDAGSSRGLAASS